MKILMALCMALQTFVAAEVPEPKPMLVDPETGQCELLIERFASPEISIPVGILAAPQSLPQVSADVFLDGGALLAPLAAKLAFHPGKPGTTHYLTNGSFVVALADVHKPVSLRMVIYDSGGKGTERRVIGKVRLRITPPGQLEALLKSRIKDHSHPLQLLVFGTAPGLREMLKDWHVPFIDSGAEPPSSAPSGSLVIGEISDPSHLPDLVNGSSVFAQTTDSGLDAESVIRESGTSRSTILRSSGNTDWRNDPKLHRLLCLHLKPH